MEKTKHVGIWIRVSTDIQVKDDSPEHHEQRARTYCDMKGWHIAEVYRLDAVSGKAVMHHSEAQRMLKDLRSGHITGLVFSKLARLARSTKELLEFAEIFRKEGADLISLAEQIDTSSPAGMLFFTIISAMAEWERQEIASRVSASIPIRAKLGKPLGGQASYGYRWEGKDFVIDESEAPIRKLMYEIFLSTQRKKTTADQLNAMGYLTRNGSRFSDNTVDRLLRDPSAKGERRANYTKSLGEGKNWTIKPESEWVITACPAIISEDTWNQVNSILIQQEQKNKRKGRTSVYLLSGFVRCECGKTMYVSHVSQIYSCKACKTKIPVSDLDELYQQYLNEYLEGIRREDFLLESQAILNDKRALLVRTISERKKLSKKLEAFLDLRLNGEITKEQFAEHNQPLNGRISAIDGTIPQLQAEIDFLSVQSASADTVLSEAQQLSTQWERMPFEKRRAIVETITSTVVIGKKNIDITLCFTPSAFVNAKNSRHNFRDSYWL